MRSWTRRWTPPSCGLLVLAEARTAAASDPSTAAELCLAAVPHLALASADLG